MDGKLPYERHLGRKAALVTAGGTREPIDDVRVLTNVSRGRFGTAIAEALASRGLGVHLLAGHELLREPEPKGVLRTHFNTFADLDSEMAEAAATSRNDYGSVPCWPNFVFMAAAVSDYYPAPQKGKIRSDAPELTIKLRRNPKILASLRERFGVECFIVGFKLLSGATRHELVAAARKQCRENRLNLVVANDLRHLGHERHPVVLVTPEGGAIDLDGDRCEVAARLVDFVLKRAAVEWCRSTQVVTLAGEQGTLRIELDAGADKAASLLRLVQGMGLLPAEDGNVSFRAGRGLVVTPRQVPKSGLAKGDLVVAMLDPGSRTVMYEPADKKPSIDTSVHARLYDALPRLESMAHFHDVLGVEDAVTAFPWPCGTREEADEVLDALAAASVNGRWSGGQFLVRLVDHGWLMGLERGGAARLASEWTAATTAYLAHLAEVGIPDSEARKLELSPVLASATVAGVLARSPERGWHSCFLVPSSRGDGTGDEVIRRLGERDLTVACHDDCKVLDYYVERAYRVAGRDGPFAILDPPSRRTDLVQAASVCLLDASTMRVLVGLRTSGKSFDGYWAFPGGKLDQGEGRLAAALRELREETGISARGKPILETVHRVGDRERAFEVANFVIPVASPAEPSRTREMDARWVGLEEAARLRPMAVGTKRVLRALVAKFAVGRAR